MHRAKSLNQRGQSRLIFEPKQNQRGHQMHRAKSLSDWGQKLTACPGIASHSLRLQVMGHHSQNCVLSVDRGGGRGQYNSSRKTSAHQTSSNTQHSKA